VEEWLADLGPGSALDVACGEGRNAVWLAERGWEVTGVDFSPLALDRARRMADEHDVEVTWVEADVTTWQPSSGWDLVLVSYVHLPPDGRGRLMRRCTEWLERGGRLFLIGHDRSTAGVSGPSDPDLLWTPEIAASSVRPLTVVEARSLERPLEDGRVAVDTVLLAERPG
jgi:SAM-dependent methyltransferase